MPGNGANQAMGQFGRITRLSDLPPRKVIIGYVKKAVALDEAGVKRAAKPRSGRPRKIAVPADLAAALKRNAKARKTFDAFSFSSNRNNNTFDGFTFSLGAFTAELPVAAPGQFWTLAGSRPAS